MNQTDYLRCAVPSDWLDAFSQCLFEWQGLEAGILAVIAAGIGVILLQRQIRQIEVHRRDDITRRHVAARLTMPLALSAISEMIQGIADEIADEIETNIPDSQLHTIEEILEYRSSSNRFARVDIPSIIIESFEKFTETLSDENDIKHVSELVASAQILASRFNSFDLQGAGARISLDFLLLDAAKVKILNDSMFNYARNIDKGPFGIVDVMSNDGAWDQIRVSVHSLLIARTSRDQVFSAISGRIDRYKQSGVRPWLEK